MNGNQRAVVGIFAVTCLSMLVIYTWAARAVVRHIQGIRPDVDLNREDIRLADGTRLTPEAAEQIITDIIDE